MTSAGASEMELYRDRAERAEAAAAAAAVAVAAARSEAADKVSAAVAGASGGGPDMRALLAQNVALRAALLRLHEVSERCTPRAAWRVSA